MSVQKPLSALETEPVGSLLTKYALPAIIAMTAVSLYNMVDSIFIGRGVGAMAISGLAITFPFMNIAAAFGALVGVGASTIVSVRLGQKNYGAAQQVLGNVVCMNIVIGGVFTLVSLIFIDPILYFFGAGEQTIGYARDYIVIILSGNIIEQRTALVRTPDTGYDDDGNDCGAEYGIGSAFYLCFRMGHSGSSRRNRTFTMCNTDVAVDSFQ